MSIDTEELSEIREWATTQGTRGIAVVFLKEWDRGALAPYTICRARQAMSADRQKMDPSPAPFVETPAPATEVVEAPVFPELTIWPGTYTMPTATGHRTFDIRLQTRDSEFAPGKLVISYLRGRDNTDDYTDFGFVDPNGFVHVWKRFRDNADLLRDVMDFMAHPELAAASTRCMRCDAKLTVPESIAAHYGPTCVKKGIR